MHLRSNDIINELTLSAFENEDAPESPILFTKGEMTIKTIIVDKKAKDNLFISFLYHFVAV